MCFMNDNLIRPWVDAIRKENPHAQPLKDNSIKELCNHGYCNVMVECMRLESDFERAGDWNRLYKKCAPEADNLARNFSDLKTHSEANKPKAARPKKPLSEAAQALKDKVMDDHFEPVEWDDIKGLHDTKQALINTFELQYQAPQLFDQNKNLKKMKSILLYGPPGTGKTMMAKAVRTHAAKQSGGKKIAFLSVTSSAILDKWVGSSGQNVAALFELARYYQPSVIFFDEFDALAPARESTGNDGGAMMQVITELLAQMQGANNTADEEVLIIGATNRPAALDSAIMSRMEKHVYVPLPDKKVRRDIIEGYLSKENQPADLTNSFMNQLAGQWTENFSAREIDQLMHAVAKARANDLHNAQGFVRIEPHPLYTKNDNFADEKTLTATGISKPTFALLPIVALDSVRGTIKDPKKVTKEEFKKIALKEKKGKEQLTPKERFMFKSQSKQSVMLQTYKSFLARMHEYTASSSAKSRQKAQEYHHAIQLQRTQERHFWAVKDEVTPQVSPTQLAELEEYNNKKKEGGRGRAEPTITPEAAKHLETIGQIYFQSGTEGVKMYLAKLKKLADNDSALCSKSVYAAVVFHSKKSLSPELDDVEDYEFAGEDEEENSDKSDDSESSDSDDGNSNDSDAGNSDGNSGNGSDSSDEPDEEPRSKRNRKAKFNRFFNVNPLQVALDEVRTGMNAGMSMRGFKNNTASVEVKQRTQVLKSDVEEESERIESAKKFDIASRIEEEDFEVDSDVSKPCCDITGCINRYLCIRC